MQSQNPVGALLKEYRQKCGYSQLCVAREIGHKDETSISKIENGERHASIRVLLKIARFIQIPMDLLEKAIGESARMRKVEEFNEERNSID